MRISTSETGTGKVISLVLDERLDCSACDLIARTARMAVSDEPHKIEVDLARTRQVLPSGLAMLLMLQHMLGNLRDRMVLVNCKPQLKRELDSSPLGLDLRVA